MNWGTKLALGMGAFITFIMCMVVYMFYIHGRDALIEENYYEKGINYNQEYKALQNVLNDDAKPQISIVNNQVLIQLKDSSSYTLVLMRPSNSNDDVKFKGNTIQDKNLIVVDKSKLAAGTWFLNLEWRSSNKDYLYKNTIKL